MTEADFQQLAQNLFSVYGWKIFFGLCGLIILNATKSFIANLIAGISVFRGNDINTDDIVWINGRKARINRVTPRKTVFIMLDVKPRRKMIIFNHRLFIMKIEKMLPVNGELQHLEKMVNELQNQITELKDD